MTIRSFFQRLYTRTVSRPIRKEQRKARLNLEPLEDRFCPSTFTVLNTLDNGSVGSLRWAVAQANGNLGPDKIDFAFNTPQTITLGSSQLQLTDTTGTTTITGPGVTVSGGGLNRVFKVESGVSASFSGLTITGGSVTGSGAGLYNLGNTTLTDCIVTGNHAVGGRVGGTINGAGGGLANKAGTLELVNCTISDNTADLAGGGVANAGIPGGPKGSAVLGTVNMTECSVTGNSAGLAAGVINGVGFLESGPSTLNMQQCYVSGNLALDGGGSLDSLVAGLGSFAAGFGFGVFNFSTARLANSTINENEGGGVFNGTTPSGSGKASALLQMNNCTVSANLGPAGPTPGLPNNLGFGVLNGGFAFLTNSTISGNAIGGVFNNAGPILGPPSKPILLMANCTVSEHQASATFTNSGFGVLNTGGENLASLFNSTISGNDGGVNNVSGGIRLTNTIVAGNTTADLQGTGFTGSKNNLIGTKGSAELVNNVDGNIVGVATADLNLAPLDDNGGPTQTMALQAGSPAIDKGAPVVFATLSATIPDTLTTSMSVFASTIFLPVGVYLKIDNEIMRITGMTNPATATVARGQLGTTAAAHGTVDVGITLAADQTGLPYAGAPDIGAFEVTDRQGPTATIVVADSTLAIGETSQVTITFSEAVTGFSNADLTVANGTLSVVASSDGGVTWTATLTPNAGIADASNFITLDNTGVQDAVGIFGTGTTDSNNYAIDTQRPTATISVADTTLLAGESSLVTIAFSEAVTGFSNADLTVANGTLSVVASSDGGVTWTATFTPNAGSTDTTNLIRLNNSGVKDAVGNAGAGTTDSNNYAIDTQSPTAKVPRVAQFVVNGGNPQRSVIRSLTLVFDQEVRILPEVFRLTRVVLDQGRVVRRLDLWPVALADVRVVNGRTQATLNLPTPLVNGVYQLFVNRGRIRNADNNILAGPNTFRFHRLAGDLNGDGRIDA